MYYFSFTRFFGIDMVVWINGLNKVKPWDLIKIGSEYFLCLGEQVQFDELYNHKLDMSDMIFELIYKWFLSMKSLKLIDFLVYEYYSTYRKVLNLFMDLDIDKFLSRQTSKKRTITYNKAEFDLGKSTLRFSESSSNGQQLVVFPDVWTLSNFCSESIFSDKNIKILYGQSTEKQKSELFRWIKNWSIWTLICTHSQLFQDWKDLKNIVLIQPDKWYYKSQQDPRYWTIDVICTMRKIWELVN